MSKSEKESAQVMAPPAPSSAAKLAAKIAERIVAAVASAEAALPAGLENEGVRRAAVSRELDRLGIGTWRDEIVREAAALMVPSKRVK